MTPRLSRTAISALTVALSLALAPAAIAASEQGDAGDLRANAQDLGDAAVTTVWGTFSSGADVDLYRVCLTNGSSFSASTVGGTTLDSQLFLFDADGLGVYANDDWNVSRGSLLPANHRFSPTRGGVHYIGISSYNVDPHSDQGAIFDDAFSQMAYPDGVVDPNGFGAALPVTSWQGPARGGPGAYRIAVTGTSVCDTTPPTVDLRTPADGARVRQGASVVVDFSCADEGGSGLASCVGSAPDGAQLDTSELGEVSVTVTARDGAGNQTERTHTVTVVDETAPEVAIATPADDAVYDRGEQVVADYSCADEPNGSGLASCEGNVADCAAVDTSTLGEHTFTVDAADNAGNTSSRSVTYTVVDTTAPAIALDTPADGAEYGLGENVVADYSCADEAGGSGLATCTGTVADGAAVDTASIGEKTFTVQASDAAGNSASKSVTYTVVYDFDGFFWPVGNPPKVNRWKAGVPVPIRFSLNGFKGPNPEAPGFPRSVDCDGGQGEQIARSSKRRPVFHYDRRSDRYTMLWKTERRWAGDCREFVLKLDDGSVHSARFEFGKKKQKKGKKDR